LTTLCKRPFLTSLIIYVIWTALVLGGGVIATDGSGSLDDLVRYRIMPHFLQPLRFRLGSVFPGMVLHWLWDFLTFLGGSILVLSLITPRLGVMGFILAMQLPLALYGVWLLRKYRHQTPMPLHPVDA
jgi:hypothetical protein